MACDPLAPLWEPARLAALLDTRLLDTPPEEAFDRLTRLASMVLRTPAAMVSLVDADRHFVKSGVGLPEPIASARGLPLSHSLCKHTVASGDPLVVDDTRSHPLVRDNPAVAEFGIAAYAGIPLSTPEGHTLGALCVLDTGPREWGEDEIRTLRTLAAAAATEIVLRREVEARYPAEALRWRRECEVLADNAPNCGDRATESAMGVSRDVTGAKRALDVLRETELRYQQLLGSVGAIVWGGCPDTFTFTFVSAEAETLLGYPVRRWTDEPDFWVDHMHPEDRKWALTLCKEATRRGEPHDFEYRMIAADGRVVWLRDVVRLVRHPDAGVELVGVMVDITDLKTAEAALRESEDRFRALTENAQDVTTIVDPDGTIRYQSPALERVLGYRPERSLGSNVLDFVHPDDWAGVRATFDEALRTPGQAVVSEYRYRHQTGSWCVLETTVNNLLDNPAVGGLVVNSRDVTAPRAAEARLRESGERFRTVVESLNETLLITDPENRVLYASPRVREMFGYAPEQVVGSVAHELLLPAAEHAAMVDRVWATSQRQEVRTMRKDGTRLWVEVHGVPFRAPDGRIIGAVGLLADISERKRAERALRETEEQLRQAQKMEAVGQLAGGIAHDFNNLLMAIKGNAELLLMDAAANDPTREELEEIKRAADRAAGLTRQLLAFSRKQVLQPRVLDLNAVVNETSRLLERLIGEDVELRTELDPALGSVRADSGQIEQVLMNLAVNARDAMPRGGVLRIRTRNARADEQLPQLDAHLPLGVPGVLLSVSDTGCGIPPEIRERIWDPFFTTKEQGKGTGLGLSTVYGIVRQSNGHVWAENDSRHGAVFHVFLPAWSCEGPGVALIQKPFGPEALALGIREVLDARGGE